MEKVFHGDREWGQRLYPALEVSLRVRSPRKEVGWLRTKGEAGPNFNLCRPSTSVGMVESSLNFCSLTQYVDIR